MERHTIWWLIKNLVWLSLWHFQHKCILLVLNDLAFKQYSIWRTLCSDNCMFLTNDKKDNIILLVYVLHNRCYHIYMLYLLVAMADLLAQYCHIGNLCFFKSGGGLAFGEPQVLWIVTPVLLLSLCLCINIMEVSAGYKLSLVNWLDLTLN
jgi:hypothetical protein